MTPERWKQVNQLFHSALERPPDQRATFLDEVCAGDEELRREVESLIRSHQQSGSFIDSPALDAAAELLSEDQPELATGTILGHYKILSLIGAGGMGEVYLAQDTKLGRKVALKLLPASLTKDDERVKRFEQEARAASALNHPNILTIHDVDEVEGFHFIAAEYIEGNTLRQRMIEGRMSQGEAVDVAIQVASALGAAHEARIIHRDIKPENIMLRPDGYVKVLDFGLAKLAERRTALTDTQSPTLAAVKTDTGVVMGTAHYMSPEQARGLAVDARTDIFSLGVVIYEMATGRLPFEGETPSHVIVAILEKEPAPLESHLPGVAAELQRVVSKALAKDREGRYKAVKDLLTDLKGLRQGLESEAKVESETRPAARSRHVADRISGKKAFAVSRPIWLAALLALVIGGAAWLYFPRNAPEPSLPPMRVTPLTSFPGREDHAAFSPDGNQIAFVWGGEKDDNPDIYVKSISGERPLRLTSDPAIDIRPAWSPDGQRIAFVRIIPSEPSFTIFVVSALGTSPERKLLSLTREPSTIAWSPDGKFIAVSDAPSSQEHPGIVLFSPETGEKRNLTSPPAQYRGDFYPAFSPDGQAFAFVRESSAITGDIYVAPITGGEPRRVTYDNARHTFNSGVLGGLSWTADGREIIFSSTRGGIPSLWSIPVSSGNPERLAVGGDNAFYPSVSRQGHRLAYTQIFGGTPIYRIKVPSSMSQGSSPTKLVASTRTTGGTQYSPDGRRIAFDSDRSGSSEIWVCDSEGLNLIQLTSFGRGHAGSPRWSPDGKQIAFDFRAAGDADVYVLSIEGGVPRRITTDASDDGVPSWSNDGRWVYFASNRGGDQQVWKVPAEGGEAVQVTRQGGFTAFESADGKYLYYSKGSIAAGVWRVPVEGGEEVLVLDQPGAGSWGAWALVGDGIYFINLKSKGGPAVEFFSFDRHEIRRIVGLEGVNEFVSGLAVSPDRRWILYTQQDPISSDIMLVENFY